MNTKEKLILVTERKDRKKYQPRPANLVESKTWRFWPKKLWAPSWGSGSMLPQEILKIGVLRLSENAFPTFLDTSILDLKAVHCNQCAKKCN